MQDAKILSKRDIAQLRKAVDRLNAIANTLTGWQINGGNDFEEPVKKRKRQKRKAVEAGVETDQS